MAAPDFEHETLPWVDRESFPAELERRREAGILSVEQAERAALWQRDGFLYLPNLVEPGLIDAFLADIEDAWERRPPEIKVMVEGKGLQPFPEVAPRSELTHHHYRVLDFQDTSEAARRLAFHSGVVDAVATLLGQPPVAMQSLYFEYGSEQHLHQDFPYVQAGILSHLIGCWIACEDVDADNGPLLYYPGSHRLPKYQWADGGIVWSSGDESEVEAFEGSMKSTCESSGLEALTLRANKGDVLLWHAALVHGGTQVLDPARSRRSLVVHFSTREGYPRDRRWPEAEPQVIEVGGGFLYQEPPPTARPLTWARTLVGRIKSRLRL